MIEGGEKMMTCIRDGWRVAGGKKVKKVGKSRRCVRSQLGLWIESHYYY